MYPIPNLNAVSLSLSPHPPAIDEAATKQDQRVNIKVGWLNNFCPMAYSTTTPHPLLNSNKQSESFAPAINATGDGRAIKMRVGPNTIA